MPVPLQLKGFSLILAPMDGITDATVREFVGQSGCFNHSVSEFIRVSGHVLPCKVFLKSVPELFQASLTASGLPVQVQILGGDPDLMARSALNAVHAGATGIDLNFGCPAPTVNRNDGGASILKEPHRIKEIVSAVRSAVPLEIPVSAKLRLGWDSINDIDKNAEMAAMGGASWLTIHCRTKVQGYAPPVEWTPLARLRRDLGIPIVANGDIWTLTDFEKCQNITGCSHFMLGRGVIANPRLPYEIAHSMGIRSGMIPNHSWSQLFLNLVESSNATPFTINRVKQWMSIAYKFGEFPFFNELKSETELPTLLSKLSDLERCSLPQFG